MNGGVPPSLVIRSVRNDTTEGKNLPLTQGLTNMSLAQEYQVRKSLCEFADGSKRSTPGGSACAFQRHIAGLAPSPPVGISASCARRPPVGPWLPSPAPCEGRCVGSCRRSCNAPPGPGPAGAPTGPAIDTGLSARRTPCPRAWPDPVRACRSMSRAWREALLPGNPDAGLRDDPRCSGARSELAHQGHGGMNLVACTWRKSRMQSAGSPSRAASPDSW